MLIWALEWGTATTEGVTYGSSWQRNLMSCDQAQARQRKASRDQDADASDPPFISCPSLSPERSEQEACACRSGHTTLPRGKLCIQVVAEVG